MSRRCWNVASCRYEHFGEEFQETLRTPDLRWQAWPESPEFIAYEQDLVDHQTVAAEDESDYEETMEIHLRQFDFTMIQATESVIASWEAEKTTLDINAVQQMLTGVKIAV